MKNHSSNTYFLIFVYFILLVLLIFNLENGFFWDTIQLGSKHANYYYQNNFQYLLLPKVIDSGHIPTFGMYISLIWKFFGRNLLVSHLAMLPFIIGIVWRLYKLLEHYISDEKYGLALLLILIDPTLLSQITLISPDVPLVFFFLLSWNAIVRNNKKLLALAIFFLFLTSLRGVMVAFCLLIVDIFYNINFKFPSKNIFNSLIKRSTIYLPSLIIFISFSIYHYLMTGWVGFHEESTWADCFERVDGMGLLLNFGVLGWRIIDFGRIGIWIIFAILLVKYRKYILKERHTYFLLIIFLCFVIVLPSNMIWAKNLLAHRYLLPIYLVFSILVAKILFSSYVHKKLRKLLIFSWIFTLLSGNFWIYPDKLSQGWDSTLAHLPYYKLRKKAIIFLDKQQIDFNTVHSFFPNLSVIDDMDLNNDYRYFRPYEKDAEYIMYSNIYNIDDDVYDTISENYYSIKEFKNKSIFVRVLRKKGSD